LIIGSVLQLSSDFFTAFLSTCARSHIFFLPPSTHNALARNNEVEKKYTHIYACIYQSHLYQQPLLIEKDGFSGHSRIRKKKNLENLLTTKLEKRRKKKKVKLWQH